jgi:hypothetical protein
MRPLECGDQSPHSKKAGPVLIDKGWLAAHFEEHLRFEMVADDAADWAKLLRKKSLRE